MPSAAEQAATVREVLDCIDELSLEGREDIEAALDALVARCEELEREDDDYAGYGEVLEAAERRVSQLESALRAYHDLMPALAQCANECGESVLYSDAHLANTRAHAALEGDAT